MRVKASMLAKDYKPSFLSFEKDQELIWRRLFIDNRQYGDMVKRLLVINSPDCMDMTNYQYQRIIDDTSIKDLRDMKCIRAVPRLEFGEHEEMKSYILLTFDDVTATSNPEYNDYVISFTVISPLDEWEMNDYKLRPWQIAGYIDGVMRDAKLAGIGKLQFLGAQQVPLNEYWGGMALMYITTHGEEEDSNPDINEAS